MSLQSRLAKLEQMAKPQAYKRFFIVYCSEREDESAAIAAGEAEFRAKGNVPANEELDCLLIQGVSPECHRRAE